MADAIIALTSNLSMKHRNRIEFKEEWFSARDEDASAVPDAEIDPDKIPDPASYLEESYLTLPSALTWVFFNDYRRLPELFEHIRELNDVLDAACAQGPIPIPWARDNYGARCLWVIEHLEEHSDFESPEIETVSPAGEEGH